TRIKRHGKGLAIDERGEEGAVGTRSGIVTNQRGAIVRVVGLCPIELVYCLEIAAFKLQRGKDGVGIFSAQIFGRGLYAAGELIHESPAFPQHGGPRILDVAVLIAARKRDITAEPADVRRIDGSMKSIKTKIACRGFTTKP